MIIDAHNHANWYGYTFDKFLKNMDENNIDKTWLLSWETPPSEYEPNGNALVIGSILTPTGCGVPVPFSCAFEFKQRAPERFILGYAPDPRRPEAISCLKSALGLYDIKVCGEIKYRMMYNNPDAIDMFRFCGEAGLPVTLHFDYADATRTGNNFPRQSWWYGGTIDTLEDMLKLCPKTNFLGHAPGFWAHISGDNQASTVAYPEGPIAPGGKIEYLLEKYPNLYCDISAGSGCRALSRDLDYTYKLMTRFGDRFVYARDYFDKIHQELIEKLNLPKNIKDMVYYKNAQRLIGED